MEYRDSQSSQLKRLPPLWVFLKTVKAIRDTIFLSIFLKFFINYIPVHFDYVKWLMIPYLMYQFVSILLEWKHFGYLLTGKELFVEKGRFIKVHRHIPLERIQGINEFTPLFYRLFGFTILLLDTGTGGDKKDSSIKLEMLSSKEAERIKNYLITYGNLKLENLKKGSDTENDVEETLRRLHYEISKKEIIIGSVTSLKALLFFTFIYSIYSDVKQFFSIEEQIDQILSFFLSSWWMILSGLFILFILSTGYGILKTYIQYGEYKVFSDSNRIYIKKGKVNYTEFSIPKEKIQAINISTTFLKKIFGIVKVRIIITNDEDEEVKTSNVLFPFINENKAKDLIAGILPEFRINQNMNRIPKSSVIIKILRTSYIWIIISLLIHFFAPSFWYLAITVIILTLISQILNGMFSSYSFKGKNIQIKKYSLFSIKLFITSRAKIEEVKLTENFLQRIFRLSSLIIVTRENPAKIIRILDIPSEASKTFYTNYKKYTVYNNKYSV
ncbi:PH domain-containing protein [Aeribacillus sp. FSL K6-1121]|uniref:PH domain-containing protein n=1 Tax=Aeribacillus TaxID=1055323 RepID=UPI0007B4D24C|nr:PH domain-containing protein [Aeribacillus pallidus]KZM52580.1 hypothetical protein A3Q35_18130 [Aeribacillus pallidus]MDR9796119.1 PH domain-containing protein [Aeribacillus pallidus]MED4485303.1 PH domain-containing protein [Aeribacillus pallidus]